MVAAFDYCLHGKGGAAPSIDTAMHGLVDAAHVDHLHPDSGIAIATAADGEAADQGDLRRQGGVGAVAPARLPARARHRRDQGAATRRRSAASSAATASPRGATPARSAEANSLWIIDTAAAYIAEHGKAEPFGAAARGVRRAARGRAARQGGRAGADHPRPGVDRQADGRPLHRLRRRPRLPGAAPSTRGWPRSARPAPTTSCAPRSGRWCSTCRRRASVEESIARLKELHAAYREDYQAYYDRHATAGLPGDARRRPAHRAGARRRHVQLRQGQADRPGRGRVLRQRDQRDARRRGRSRRTPRSTSRRSSGSSTGRWRRPSSSGCRSPSRSPPGSRS